MLNKSYQYRLINIDNYGEVQESNGKKHYLFTKQENNFQIIR